MSRGFREVRLGREQAQQGSTVAKAPAALAQHLLILLGAWHDLQPHKVQLSPERALRAGVPFLNIKTPTAKGGAGGEGARTP